jgi:hypothetical protein
MEGQGDEEGNSSAQGMPHHRQVVEVVLEDPAADENGLIDGAVFAVSGLRGVAETLHLQDLEGMVLGEGRNPVAPGMPIRPKAVEK